MLALAPPPAVSAAGCRGENAAPTSTNAKTIRSATRCLVNAERRARGLRRLKESRPLTNVAQEHSAAMVSQRFFAHVSPDGRTLLRRVRGRTAYLAKASSFALGENLAWGEGRLATPKKIVAAWMRSRGHRRIILTPGFRELGVGVVVGTPSNPNKTRSATYTAEFGRRTL